MRYLKYITVLVVTSGFFIAGCSLGKSDPEMGNLPSVMAHADSNTATKRVTMVISNVPFPTEILDTLHSMHVPYIWGLPNPIENLSVYDDDNSQAINLGVYGADLSYVISFEQFVEVGHYMKATKILADKAGIPMAFTASVFERCQHNSNNKDSLSRMVYESYNEIDKELKGNQRKSQQLLVLSGGWVEGAYLTTQSMDGAKTDADKQGTYRVLLDQRHYLDILLGQLDLITDSKYCEEISNSLHDIRGAFNNLGNGALPAEDALKILTDKVNNLRTRIVKGGTA